MRYYKLFGVFVILILAACSGNVDTITVTETITITVPETASAPPPKVRDLEIVTLLPKDGIPAIDDPVFVSADKADLQYEPDELVIGVNFDGDARAYSIPMLSSHEIVNDTVGGRKIAVTW